MCKGQGFGQLRWPLRQRPRLSLSRGRLQRLLWRLQRLRCGVASALGEARKAVLDNGASS